MTQAVLTLAGAGTGTDILLAWVEFDLPGGSTYAWAGVAVTDPASFYHGYKEARLISLQDMTEAYSDISGTLQATTCVFEISDLPDQSPTNLGMLVRGWLGLGYPLRNANVRIRVSTVAQQANGDTPITVFTGLVQRYAALADYLFQFECSDWIYPKLQQNVTNLTVLDLFPNAPTAAQQVAIPIAIGHLSDEPSGGGGGTTVGWQDAVGLALNSNFTESTDGMIVVLNMLPDAPSSVVINSTTVATIAALEHQSVAVPYSAGQTAQVSTSSAGAQAWFFALSGDTWGAPVSVALNADFTETQHGIVLLYNAGNEGGVYALASVPYSEVSTTTDSCATVPYIAGETGHITTSGGSGLTAMFYPFTGSTAWSAPVTVPIDGSAFSEVTAGLIVMYNAGNEQGSFTMAGSNFARVNEVYHMAAGCPYVSTETASVVPWGGGGLSAWFFAINGGMPGPPIVPATGIIPLIATGTQYVDTASTGWLAYLAAAHAVKGNFTLYSHTSAGVITSLDSLDDTQVSCPGRTGFAARWGATPYRVVNDVRCTLVYVAGALQAALAAGTVTLWANFDGAETVGDGTGTVITTLPDALALLFDNILGANTPNIGNANWAASPPTFSDGTPRRDVTSFATAAANAAVVMPAGMDGCRWIASTETWSTLLAELLVSGTMRVAENGLGQLQVFITNPSALPTATLDEVTEILSASFTFADTDQGYANAIPYSFSPTYSASGTSTDAIIETAEDLVSQMKYNERIAASAVSIPWRRNALQAAQTINRLMLESSTLPRTVSLASGLHWLTTVAVGQVVGITHRQGGAAFGWTIHPSEIRGRRTSIEQARVDLTCCDLIDLDPSVAEDIVANQSIGGSADFSIGEQPNGVVPWSGARLATIDWDTLSIAYTVFARVWTKQAGGASQTPQIYSTTSTWTSPSLVVAGTAETGSGWTMQVLTIPRGTGTMYYFGQSLIAGATTSFLWALGDVEATL